MSRVDEALRRASLDMTSVLSLVAVDPPALAVDGSALDVYAGEQRAPTRKRADPSAVILRPPSPPASLRQAALHASLEGKAVVSRETSPVSIEQYRRLATALHAIQSERGRSEEHTSELQSRGHLVCRLLLEKKKNSN